MLGNASAVSGKRCSAPRLPKKAQFTLGLAQRSLRHGQGSEPDGHRLGRRPPVSWRALHQAVEILLEDLDSYKVKIADWLVDQGVLQR